MKVRMAWTCYQEVSGLHKQGFLCPKINCSSLFVIFIYQVIVLDHHVFSKYIEEEPEEMTTVV